LAGEEGADLRRWRGPIRSNKGVGRRADAGGVFASLSSGE
jgi:hypothetical protein